MKANEQLGQARQAEQKPVVRTLVKKINLRVGWDIIGDPKDNDQNNPTNKYKCGFCHKFLVSPPPQELQANDITNAVVIEGKLTKGKCNCIFHEKCMNGYLNAGNLSCPHCNTPWAKEKELRSSAVYGNIENLTIKERTQINQK